jgi:hypothetical protein
VRRWALCPAATGQSLSLSRPIDLDLELHGHGSAGLPRSGAPWARRRGAPCLPRSVQRRPRFTAPGAQRRGAPSIRPAATSIWRCRGMAARSSRGAAGKSSTTTSKGRPRPVQRRHSVSGRPREPTAVTGCASLLEQRLFLQRGCLLCPSRRNAPLQMQTR